MTTGQAGKSFGTLAQVRCRQRRRLKTHPIAFSSAAAAMADAEIIFFIFNGMAWLSPRCAHLMVYKPRENMCLGETVQQAAGAGVAVCGPCCSRHRGGGVHPRLDSASRRARRAAFLNVRPKGTREAFFPRVLPPLKRQNPWILYRF